ncbi:hypothetical protein [Bacillus sp. 165]|uniref:hypothetical protein n=1 Tax=Bacillus sp. 165 TaxID=1529117 RepID=UPI001ADAFDE6|nr:hypothetical protein [Bacillus sp. 165]MBO9128579.1 hypothetical protein [Bacillus sp. 165]
MLLDKVRETRQLVEKVKLAEERANRHQEYQDFYQKLIEKSPDFDQFIEALRSMLTSPPETFVKPDLSQILIKINELLSTFESEPKQSLISALSKEIRIHDEQWKVKWTDYATKKSQEVIRGLNSVKQVAGSVDDINTIIRVLESLANKWPISESNITQFSKHLFQAKEKLMSLNTTPEVQQFLNRVANNEATIADITSEVMEWLRDNNFLNNLKISFK